jgi:hypothetical protein
MPVVFTQAAVMANSLHPAGVNRVDAQTVINMVTYADLWGGARVIHNPGASRVRIDEQGTLTIPGRTSRFRPMARTRGPWPPRRSPTAWERPIRSIAGALRTK